MASSKSVRNSRRAKRRVFLAEDHKLVREGLAALLEMTGEFEIVGQCGHGLHVVQQIADARPEAVLLDVNMPGVNGIEICRELTRTLPDVAVLVLSMQGNEAFIIRALEHGAMGYLLKESAGTDLVEALKTIMAGSIYLDPAIGSSILKSLHKPRQDAYETLSSRERQVLQLVAEGLTNKKIAEKLGLAVKTVDTHRMRLMKKLGIHDVTTLVKFFLNRNGGLTT